MKKSVFSACITVFSVIAISTAGYSFSIGGYFTGGIGKTTMDGGISSTIQNHLDPKHRSTLRILGGGIVFDSCAARDQLINYRASLGYNEAHGSDNNPWDIINTRVEFQRISFINTVGFGLVRTKYLRGWIGPQLGLHYITGYLERALTPYTGIYRLLYEKAKHLGQADLGIALGFNFHVVKNLSLIIESSFRYGIIYGPGKSLFDQENIMFNGFEATANIGMLFRVNDSYTGQEEKV